MCQVHVCVKSTCGHWHVPVRRRNTRHSLSNASCFSCRQIFLDFSIQIMLLYTLNLKGIHWIGIKWIQVILRSRYLVKRSGNVHKYDNQWQFVTILLGLWQLKEINITLFHAFLNCLMTYAVLNSHGTQQEDFGSCKSQNRIWWMWVKF